MSNPRDIRNRKIAPIPRLEQLSLNDFIGLFPKHFPDRDTTSVTKESDNKTWSRWFYDLIDNAFLSAEVGLQYHRVTNGPSLQDRANILRSIETDISSILEKLSGENDTNRQQSAKISDAFWHYLTLAADEDFTPRQAYSALLKIRSLLQTAGLAMANSMKEEQELEPSPTLPGRPRNIHKDILYRELTGAWEKATGEKPTLKIDTEGFADCQFCKFFESYFGGSGPTAEAIAAHCARLP